MRCDVIVIGAGAAGLAAASTLSRLGRNVRILEAQPRVGGRIRTEHDPSIALPIELGAEFVHGKPSEIWNIIRDRRLAVYEHSSEALHISNGTVRADEQSGEAAEELLARANRKRKDQSVAEFERQSRQPEELRREAVAFLEGFNAGAKERLGVKAVKRDMDAASEIEGDRAFRILNGYESVIAALREDCDSISLNTAVHRVQWQKGRARVHARNLLDGQEWAAECRCVIVTVPLGVLQAAPHSLGSIAFDPGVPSIARAIAKLEFGDVYRITFQFAEAFWQDHPKLAKAGFWISDEKVFPTWWTGYPMIAPLLTGWSAGPAAEPLRGFDRADVIKEALRSFSRILNRKIPQPLSAHFEDWRANPFVRGAYSYASVGSIPQRKVLARPIEETLIFAGEATNTEGHAATVHGAIASGARAARQAERALNS